MSVVDSKTCEMTFFGFACVKFAQFLLNKTLTSFDKWEYDTKDYIRVFFPKYFDMFYVSFTDGTTREYQIHKMLYGPLKVDKDGRTSFQSRICDETFWMKQWGHKYSPFRVVQEYLKRTCNLYLVDHTTKGDTPFIFLHKFAPFGDNVPKFTWHNGNNVPCLTDEDFTFVPGDKTSMIVRVDDAYDAFEV